MSRLHIHHLLLLPPPLASSFLCLHSTILQSKCRHGSLPQPCEQKTQNALLVSLSLYVRSFVRSTQACLGKLNDRVVPKSKTNCEHSKRCGCCLLTLRQRLQKRVLF
jgi:hypothetical protein